MTGHIRKRGRSSWELRWYSGGNVQTKTVRGTKRDAQRELNRVLGEIATGDYVAPSKMTLAQFHTHWLKGIKDSVKPRTHQWYGDMLRIHVLPHLGELKLSEIMPLHIQEMYSSLSESELSKSTVAGIHRDRPCFCRESLEIKAAPPHTRGSTCRA
jgi:integrase